MFGKDITVRSVYKCRALSSFVLLQKRDSYKEHLLIHVGPRHACPHCSRVFVQRSNMLRHIRLHTGEKPYSCIHCDKTFSDKGACNAHIRFVPSQFLRHSKNQSTNTIWHENLTSINYCHSFQSSPSSPQFFLPHNVPQFWDAIWLWGVENS